MFFRWLKCIPWLPTLAGGEPGWVALQVYLALIAAQLQVLYNGERPTKRQMEAIQLYVLGWASLEALMAKLQPTGSKPASTARKKS